MKKNVFSRAIAVLASMTVLGAATMITASAKGVTVGTVEVEQGATEAKVPVYLDDVTSTGGQFTYTASAPILSATTSVSLAFEGDITGDGYQCVYFSGNPYGATIDTLTVELNPTAEPGSYPINIEIELLDDNGSPVADPVAVNGAIVIKEAEEPATDAPTEAPTDAPTEAPVVATKAPATTTKKPDSPKTGDAGVVAAVAGLVTAGAAAVVLKKKH